MNKTPFNRLIFFLFRHGLLPLTRERWLRLQGCACRSDRHDMGNLTCPVTLMIEKSVFERAGLRNPAAAPFEERGVPAQEWT